MCVMSMLFIAFNNHASEHRLKSHRCKLVRGNATNKCILTIRKTGFGHSS